MKWIICFLFVFPIEGFSQPTSLEISKLSSREYVDYVIATVKTDYKSVFQTLGREITFEVSEETNWRAFIRPFKIHLNPYEDKTLNAYLICHEVGHLIGGPPFMYVPSEDALATVEGEADYFAGVDCLKRLFRHENNQAALVGIEIPKEISQRCEHFSHEPWVCKRIVYAGYLWLDVWSEDQSVYTGILGTSGATLYPEKTCRQTTLIHAALCNERNLDIASIILDEPRTIVANNHLVPGRDYCNSQIEARRPRCWYNP